jgi:hypothetical protein
MTRKARAAWELYLKLESGQGRDAAHLLTVRG